jgi:hypothetical protein
VGAMTLPLLQRPASLAIALVRVSADIRSKVPCWRQSIERLATIFEEPYSSSAAG